MQRGTIEFPTPLTVRLSADQVSQLRAIAKADDRPPSALARRLLADALAKYESPKEVPV